MRNSFGYAENLELRVDGFKERYDLQHFNPKSLPGGLSLDLKLSVPRLNGTQTTLEADVHHNQRNLQKWSSFVDQRTGFSLGAVR